MADAGVLRAGDRLPWLEPYRAPPRKTSNRKAGLAALLGVAGLAGVAAMLAVGIVPIPEVSGDPSAEVTLPPPAIARPDPVEAPAVEPAAIVQTETPVASPPRVAAPSHRQQITRRRLKAEPTREEFGKVVSEQAVDAPAAEPISAEAMAIAAMPVPAPAVDPPRPAVNPSARVVRGKTVQLGVFKTQRQAEIAWRSAIRDYTYLVTMPKSIEPIRIRSKTYFRLQLGTPSQSHAKQLCGNLRGIGRSCRVA